MWIETDNGVVNLAYLVGIMPKGYYVKLWVHSTDADFTFERDEFLKIYCKTPAAASAYYNRIVKQLDVLSRHPDDCDDPFVSD